MRLNKLILVWLMVISTSCVANTQLTLSSLVEIILNKTLKKYNETQFSVLEKSSTRSEAGIYPALGFSYSYTQDQGSADYGYASGNAVINDSNDSSTTSTRASAFTLTETFTNIVLPLLYL